MPHSFYFRTNDGVGSAAQSGVDVGSTLALAKPAPSLTRHEAFVPPEQFAKKGNSPLGPWLEVLEPPVIRWSKATLAILANHPLALLPGEALANQAGKQDATPPCRSV